MPNERNVAALELPLAQAAEGQLDTVPPPSRDMVEGSVRQTIASVAQHLSDQGVLVPSVLTEDEAVKIGADSAGKVPGDRSETALCVREGLERIAEVRPEGCRSKSIPEGHLT
jgi:hypothetical protein